MSDFYFSEGQPKEEGERKFFIATTCYEKPAPGYSFSIALALAKLREVGVKFSYGLLSGDCHVDDARNVVSSHFLASDCDALIFIDADVYFEEDNLLELTKYVDEGHLYGGVYPYKNDAKAGMPVRGIAGEKKYDKFGNWEQGGLPTGFLMIPRLAFEKLIENGCPLWFSKGKKIYEFFKRRISYGSGRIGGDIGFSLDVASLGIKAYAIQNLIFGHTGQNTVTCSLEHKERKIQDMSLQHVGKVLKDPDADHYNACIELHDYASNPFSLNPNDLLLLYKLASRADKPILEFGSGLSTIVSACATDQTVFAFEHDPLYQVQLEQRVIKANINNVAMVKTPINVETRFYQIEEQDLVELPNEYFMMIVDGPPRLLGDRLKFLETPFIHQTNIIVVDDINDLGYFEAVKEALHEFDVSMSTDRMAIFKRKPQ